MSDPLFLSQCATPAQEEIVRQASRAYQIRNDESPALRRSRSTWITLISHVLAGSWYLARHSDSQSKHS